MTPQTCLPSLYKTIKYNTELTKTVLLSSILHQCSIICRISPASGDVSHRPSTRALCLDPNGELTSPDSLTNSRFPNPGSSPGYTAYQLKWGQHSYPFKYNTSKTSIILTALITFLFNVNCTSFSKICRLDFEREKTLLLYLRIFILK